MLILLLRHPENQIDAEIIQSVPDNYIMTRLQAAHIPLDNAVAVFWTYTHVNAVKTHAGRIPNHEPVWHEGKQVDTKNQRNSNNDSSR